MATRKLISKSINVASGDYIGRDGELWVDTVSNLLKISDGATPGGVVVTTDGGDGITWAAITNINNANGPDTVAIGRNAGSVTQGTESVAIGDEAGKTSQGNNAVAVGNNAGETSQGASAVSIGDLAGNATQGQFGIAIGASAGQTTQGANAVAIGLSAGQTTQGASAVAVGNNAGKTTQGTQAVAIGYYAGETSQGNEAVAIGKAAGTTTQGIRAVAIGYNAGAITQGIQAVAIGQLAGQTTQGTQAVAIGYLAGETSQAANSIVINATGLSLNNIVEDTFVVKPIRNATMTTILGYDVTTGEVTHNAAIPYPANAGVSWDGIRPTTVDGALDRLALYTQDFAVSTDAHWADPDPADITDAINRLAAAIYALNGNTGI